MFFSIEIELLGSAERAAGMACALPGGGRGSLPMQAPAIFKSGGNKQL